MELDAQVVVDGHGLIFKDRRNAPVIYKSGQF